MSEIEFKKSLEENINLKKSLFNKDIITSVNKIVHLFYTTIKSKKKILVCGNGGSAADAQHLCAEFIVRLNPKKNRKALPMMTLAVDTSTITACGNDFNFNKVFSRSLEALGQKGDLLLIISTSGMSKNIIEVLRTSKKMKIKSIGFLGKNGGKAKKLVNHKIIVPHSNVARIQETHIFLGHVILNCVEKKLFP